MIYLLITAFTVGGFFVGALAGALLTNYVSDTDLSKPHNDYD